MSSSASTLLAPFSLSLSSAVLSIILLFLIYTVIFAIYNLTYSPLSAIPGPWYAAISDLWITSHVLRLQQCKTVHSLFETYGPVVRVGPNKVVFRDVSTMRNVYSVHKFDKSTYYKSLLTNDNDHAMTTLEHAPHSIRKKAYAPHYNPSNLAKFQPEMHDSTLELVDTLLNTAGKTPLECLTLFRHLMVDVLVSSSFGASSTASFAPISSSPSLPLSLSPHPTSATFTSSTSISTPNFNLVNTSAKRPESRPRALSRSGYRLGALNKWGMDVQDPLSVAINDFPKRGILRSAVPTWAWNLVCRIPNNRWRQMCDSDKIMAEFVSARVYEMRAQLNAGKLDADGDDSDEEKAPMLERLLKYQYPSSGNVDGKMMPDNDIISETMGHMIAGSDTTSTTLSYLFWELTRRPDILKKLQAEIDDVMPDSRNIPDISVLQNLPYLNAFIKEGLRVYSSAPSLLERTVPASTSKNGATNEAFDLMGYALPPGTIVSTQAWSMHRDTSVFPSPDTFLPERWLEVREFDAEKRSIVSNADQLLRMNQHMMPFGTGSRMCGGQNLAHMMLRVAVVAIVRNFEIEAPLETNERTMDMRDSFVIFPAAMECKLIFNPRKL